MVKAKNRKGISDKVRNKQRTKSKQPSNPFEIKVNKIKHSVVNKKVQKWEKGVPGVSRSKAVKQRKDTLLRELHHMKKANSLLDKRFGEKDSTMSADEKMVQRFALERKKQMKKGDFSLNEEEEVLTHYGQSLAENLKDTIGSDSEDDGSDGKLRMGSLQFGGFSKDSDEVSWKDKMKEVIADSKKHKYDRQAEKEKTLEATKELDSCWKTLVSNFKPVHNNQPTRKASSFMQLFHHLVMEQKSGGATDKLKTEEEKAKEEAERLKLLETHRIARMKGASNVSKNTHMSADDLNDGFALEKGNRSVSFAEPNGFEDKSEDGESSKQDEAEISENENNEKDQNGDGSESGDDDDDESDDNSDDYSDLASEDENDSDEEPAQQVEKSAFKQKQGVAKPKSILKNSEIENICIGKEISTSLPFVFTAPGSYEELKSLLHGHSTDEQSTILSRLRKCYHPSLAEGNKEKLEKIQIYLLQYFGEVVKQQPLDKNLVDHVTSNIWELTQMFKASSATALQNILIDHQKMFITQMLKRNGRGTYPDIDTLMYLKLVECLFPTSDYQHPVTTPAIHFITQMLSECMLRSNRDVVAGTFVCSLALKFVDLSKRFIPEVVTFLHGLLYLGAVKDGSSDIKVYPPHRVGSKAVDLCVQQKCLSASGQWSLSEMLNKEPVELNNDQFRCEAIVRCLELLLDCIRLWEELPCLTLVFEPCMRLLTLLPKHLYPADVEEKIQSLSQKYDDAKLKKLKVMQQPSKKPVPLKLFEPEIQEFWSGKHKKGGPNKEVNDRQRLKHKYKREFKAAVREIKRDNEVLARHQLDTILQKDADRKRKTKELMQNLASQEGDYKAMKKMKK
uniref:Nucleolar protein 14 n=1 Tax=Arion vulgaris TaxID=1028688 RepID=A0A0B7A112_9EUPU